MMVSGLFRLLFGKVVIPWVSYGYLGSCLYGWITGAYIPS